MTERGEYERRLLEGWEEVFKRGQLTFWVLLALRHGPKHMAEIRRWMLEVTDGGVTAEDRSLYRALQRFRDAELVTAASAPGERGPERKLYSLTPVGDRLLSDFVDRDIRPFFDPEVRRLIGAG